MVSGSKNDSRIKKKKSANGKQGLTFAKNKNQVILAIVLVGLLILNSVYIISKNFIAQANEKAMIKNAETTMAAKQKQDLESLDNPLSKDMGNAPTEPTIAQDANDIYSQTLSLQGAAPEATATSGKKTAPSTSSDGDNIEIMSKKTVTKNSGKMVLISVESSGRSNPFLPAAENVVPSSLPNFSLMAPPESDYPGSDAGKVMTTTIAGILYDKYSPSAIIKIEGSDYLVKKGDIINKYKVLAIDKSQVIVQLGKNIYKAGVGELLSQTDLNYNTIANLNKKFGGNDVSINVKRKGY